MSSVFNGDPAGSLSAATRRGTHGRAGSCHCLCSKSERKRVTRPARPDFRTRPIHHSIVRVLVAFANVKFRLHEGPTPIRKPRQAGEPAGARLFSGPHHPSTLQNTGRRPDQDGPISCGAGSCCACGASYGRLCGDPFLDGDWPCVLLRGFGGAFLGRVFLSVRESSTSYPTGPCGSRSSLARFTTGSRWRRVGKDRSGRSQPFLELRDQFMDI